MSWRVTVFARLANMREGVNTINTICILANLYILRFFKNQLNVIQSEP